MTARPAVPAAAAADRVLFGPFELDLQRGRLLRAGVPVDVPPRPFALLCQLARQQGRVVPKDELLDAVWGQDFLGGSALKATVNNLRRALGEDGRSPRWVVSVARRGYCLQARPDAPPQALADAAGARPTGPDRS
jgi:DNA-binding winged helix-turn-helix (wHTH) protein